MKAFAAAVVLASSGLAAGGPARAARPVMLPGVGYEVLVSGPATGAHPTRADTVAIRYVGRLSTSEIFSSSPENGAQTAEFKVSQLIPGMNAALQLMRPGDEWILYVPPELGYGSEGAGGGEIPPGAALIFRIELIDVLPGPETIQKG